MEAFSTVFDELKGSGCMDGPAMAIELLGNFISTTLINAARPITFADRPSVKQKLDEYVEAKIIAHIMEQTD